MASNDDDDSSSASSFSDDGDLPLGDIGSDLAAVGGSSLYLEVNVTEVNQGHPGWERIAMMDDDGFFEETFVPRPLVNYTGTPAKDVEQDNNNKKDDKKDDDNDKDKDPANNKTIVTPSPNAAQSPLAQMLTKDSPFNRAWTTIGAKFGITAEEAENSYKAERHLTTPRRLYTDGDGGGNDDDDGAKKKRKKRKKKHRGKIFFTDGGIPIIYDKEDPLLQALVEPRFTANYVDLSLLTVLFYSFCELVYNLAVPNAVKSYPAFRKTPIIKTQHNVLHGFLAAFAFMYGQGAVGVAITGANGININNLKRQGNAMYNRAVKFLKLVTTCFQQGVGNGDWSWRPVRLQKYLRFNLRHWWDNMVKRILLNGIQSVEWLQYKIKVEKVALEPNCAQGVFFPVALMWHSTMHGWDEHDSPKINCI